LNRGIDTSGGSAIVFLVESLVESPETFWPMAGGTAMKKILSEFFTVVLFMTILAYGYAQEKTAKEEAFAASAKSLMEEYSASLLAGDTERWISLWDSDAVQAPDVLLYHEGVADIQSAEADFLRIAKYEAFEIRITKTHVDETLGYVYGDYREAYVYKANRVRVQIAGKYADILKRQSDGSWKIVFDIANVY
jgi:ketosteroid isomerase-like protein